MQATAIGTLDLPTLPSQAQTAHVFKEMSTALISVPELCDTDCRVTFLKTHVTVYDSTNKIILVGRRDLQAGLWLVPLQQPTPNQLALIAYHQGSKPALTRYLHACAGYPTTATWTKAIDNGHYITWPGLTSTHVRKYLPPSEETTMGHMHLLRKGIHPTTTDSAPIETPRELATRRQQRQHNVGAHTIQFDTLKGMISTDQAGRFPISSARGHKYIFVLYYYDSNAILAEPIISRKKEHLLQGYKTCFAHLQRAGIHPIIQRLDNEVSDLLIAAIVANNLDYQFASASDHQLNPAERAIQSFKNHFISILNGADASLPAIQWNRLVFFAMITLCMLRTSRINPQLSAYAQLWGNFDFNHNPLAPAGCKAIIHQRAHERGTWAKHGEIVYFVSPAMHHYRNYKIYIPKTHGERVSNTVQFFLKHTIPKVSSADEMTDAIQTLTKLVRQPHVPETFPQRNDSLVTAINDLQTMMTSPQRNQPYAASAAPDPSQRVVEPQPTQRVEPVATKRVENPIAQRLHRLQRLQRQGKRHAIGTSIVKRFMGKLYEGWVIDIDKEEGYYKIGYGDGDEEEMTYQQVLHHRVGPPPTQFQQLRIAQANRAISQAKRRLLHQHTKEPTLTKHLAYAVYDEAAGKSLEYRELMKHPDPVIRKQWNHAGANEFGRLLQGIRDIEGTDTMFFVNRKDVPEHKTVTYSRMVCDIRPQKEETHRMRMTAGGDRLEYAGKTSTESASLETIKIHWNSVLSTPKARYMTMDISNMYLNTKLPEPEYMRIHVSLIPNEIMKAYNPNTDPKGYCYVKIFMAIYDLKQSGALANKELQHNLAKHGYYPMARTPGLYKHKSRPINFSLVVDDFGVLYESKADAQHLESSLKEHYPITTDWSGDKYIGVDLEWNYDKRELITSMKGYVKRALQ